MIVVNDGRFIPMLEAPHRPERRARNVTFDAFGATIESEYGLSLIHI